ncbi:hypothetical protein WJ75_30725 [Burkholderia ubonensis]|nr:hypothetical protein WJ75_30725 [Burkholderia ubonensis]
MALTRPIGAEGTTCQFIFPECKHAGAGMADDLFGAVDFLRRRGQTQRITFAADHRLLGR